ncbi:REC8 meiotic recombination protein b [Genypterus blacodes]|uniref:REC8 meiotic recombination protein b n=1 Tax=Genypterus blacodes TaxID=154954 RepID=UPI003F75C11F
MFYYPNVLHRHTGCFSTIWLMATRATKVNRRELLKVNVNLTCEGILNYITAQVPPPQPNQPKPQFSLYLSSQLQYGVVVVYHRQCGLLLAEIQQTIRRLLRVENISRIDMDQHDNLDLDVPDNLNMMEIFEGAQDPFFGLMEAHQLPSPYRIQQVRRPCGFEMYQTHDDLICDSTELEAVDSQHSLVTSDHTTPANEDSFLTAPSVCSSPKPGFRSPLDTITMAEKQQAVVAGAGFFEGDELPEATDREINLLMNEQDDFPGGLVFLSLKCLSIILCVCVYVCLLKETMQGKEWDSVGLQGEESGPPVRVYPASFPSETTPTQVAMPPEPKGEVRQGDADGEAVAPPNKKCRHSRRRQLVFADPQVQISQRRMSEQILNPRAETQELSGVLLGYPSLAKRAAPAQLFGAPCGLLFHADLLSLWKQSLQYGQDREILSDNTEAVRDRSDMKEVCVCVCVSVCGSPQAEDLLLMEPITEETTEMTGDSENADMLSWISGLRRSGSVTFASLLPPQAERSTAAHRFFKLLELLSVKKVSARQDQPHSDIIIIAS